MYILRQNLELIKKRIVSKYELEKYQRPSADVKETYSTLSLTLSILSVSSLC